MEQRTQFSRKPEWGGGEEGVGVTPGVSQTPCHLQRPLSQGQAMVMVGPGAGIRLEGLRPALCPAPLKGCAH